MEYVVIDNSKAIYTELNWSILIVAAIGLFVYMIGSFLIGAIYILCVVIVLRGYSQVYKITKDFDNKIQTYLFGKLIWESKLEVSFPDYISIFHASFLSIDRESGTHSRHKRWVVRFFVGNKYDTVGINNDYNYISEKAIELGKLLEVEVFDRSKE
ncbi:hypothetical protein [Aquimarina sp. I32.4]|uniref:hypothetical protein n=1 Tax=Aquimarina sp. I32.4 TaxID=2053903 RepID=UPI000CDEFBC5|nr:hypothetical protein [Aquimarina sp. I32.4]